MMIRILIILIVMMIRMMMIMLIILAIMMMMMMILMIIMVKMMMMILLIRLSLSSILLNDNVISSCGQFVLSFINWKNISVHLQLYDGSFDTVF